jgi:hypothetical protein
MELVKNIQTEFSKDVLSRELRIGVGIQISERSWGEFCQRYNYPKESGLVPPDIRILLVSELMRQSATDNTSEDLVNYKEKLEKVEAGLKDILRRSSEKLGIPSPLQSAGVAAVSDLVDLLIALRN